MMFSCFDRFSTSKESFVEWCKNPREKGCYAV
jgi:hypothetical protein